jgi:hypothetical protein
MAIEIAAALISGVVALTVLLFGWVHFRMNALSNRITELDEKKLNVKEFHEVRDDIKAILRQITELQVKQALWQGRAEVINRDNNRNS